MRAGIVTFDFPPQYRRADVSDRPVAVGSPLARLLAGRGVALEIPLADLASRDPAAGVGIRDGADLDACLDALRAARVECLLIDAFHWCRLALVRQLVEALDVPTAVYANTGEGWNGVPAASAICGSLREAPRTRTAALVEAFLDSEEPAGLFRWMAGATALSRLRRSRALLWGGGYGAEIPYTRSDPAALEACCLGEILTEPEATLVRRAQRILADGPQRVKGFLDWLAHNKVAVRFDGRMLTPECLDFQAALYLAARDRLGELGGDGIAGAAIKCHYEMSTDWPGCTGCLLPAFLPFGVDAEGARPVVPFACEGDLNGLVGLMILHAVQPAVPPLFGDLVAYRPDHLLLRNCGAASAYWAGRSGDPARCLARLSLAPTLHGKSGAAVHYETPACEECDPPGEGVTFLRLFREGGRFGALLGEGRVLAERDGSRYADPWPHTRLALGADPSLLFKAMPCNHGSLTEGRLMRELELFCAHAGIRTYRCDAEGLAALLAERRRAGAGAGA